MNKTLRLAGLGLCLAAGVLAAGLGGCTVEQMQWMDRQHRCPADYDRMPLGKDFDTRDEIARLKDETLRNRMALWMDMRESYLTLWREKGDYNSDVKELRNKRSLLWSVIQDQRDQLRAMGKPLTD